MVQDQVLGALLEEPTVLEELLFFALFGHSTVVVGVELEAAGSLLLVKVVNVFVDPVVY